MYNEKTGYIYVLTNESFHKDDWIKIGYAEDVERRVKELSNTSVPLPYEVYCTYEIPRIVGTKDPDKLLHDLISRLNPDLRISPNREFFEIQPWAAYEMLRAIAQMHGRLDKLHRNEENTADKEEVNDAEYSVDRLFKPGTEERAVYDRLKDIILKEEPSLTIVPTRVYVSFKMGNRNTISMWPRRGWLEVVLNAKLGQLSDDLDLVYDISNRQWSSEQYAFKFYGDTDEKLAQDIIKQVIDLKR